MVSRSENCLAYEVGERVASAESSVFVAAVVDDEAAAVPLFFLRAGGGGGTFLCSLDFFLPKIRLIVCACVCVCWCSPFTDKDDGDEYVTDECAPKKKAVCYDLNACALFNSNVWIDSHTPKHKLWPIPMGS